jgi:hypothetical protein
LHHGFVTALPATIGNWETGTVFPGGDSWESRDSSHTFDRNTADPSRSKAKGMNSTLNELKNLTKANITMKYLLVTILLAITLGCGSPNSQVGNQPQTTSLAGTWTIAAASPEGSSLLTAKIVSSPCTVIQDGEKFWVDGTVCFVADNLSGNGSVTGVGSFIYPPQGVLMGTAVNPVPNNSVINILFVESDLFGDFAGFVGTGSVTSTGSMTGTFNCDSVNTPICFGDTGTFTATQN